MIFKKIDIWENLIYEGEGEDGFRPTLDIYILDGSKKRGAVLICPGGAYVAVSANEAEPIAMQFNAAGFHAFVLNYSVAPRKHPQPLLDASRAMCIIREKSDEWNIYPDRIAVCGFSAGGHLAASLGVHWEKSYIQNAQGVNSGMNRPDALILCYSVITSGEFGDMYSFNKLLGEDADEELLHEMSVECHVNEQTPPAFIWHTCNDEDT
ncbi:MAG: acetylesterase, partial [Clostridiales bacterium GWC2_40_7]